MKKCPFPFVIIALAMIATVMGAGPAKFDGEFVDKKFLNGQGVFQFSVHQSGSALEIAFDAAYSDGHGATPDATGAGKVNGNAAEFTWKDSQGNTGTGTLTSLTSFSYTELPGTLWGPYFGAEAEALYDAVASTTAA